jgi:hypothetical protein
MYRDSLSIWVRDFQRTRELTLNCESSNRPATWRPWGRRCSNSLADQRPGQSAGHSRARVFSAPDNKTCQLQNPLQTLAAAMWLSSKPIWMSFNQYRNLKEVPNLLKTIHKDQKMYLFLQIHRYECKTTQMTQKQTHITSSNGTNKL